MVSLGLLARTLVDYPPGQLAHYALRRMSRPRPDERPAPRRRAPRAEFVRPIGRPYPEIERGIFRLLNVERPVRGAADWNAPDAQMLWLYTLHYHEGLSAGPKFLAQQEDLILRWIADNPPGEGVGWDAYPISLRVLQWIKWLLRGGPELPGMLDSLAVQIRYLSASLETHLGANHLFSNAIALAAGGLFFEGAEAERWSNRGLRILAREWPKQFLADGGHFELSPAYHALLLEQALDTENIFRAFAWEGPRPWSDSLIRLRRWSALMAHPDGTYPGFNDSARSAAPSRRAVEAYLEALGFGAMEPTQDGTIDLPDTGYVRYSAEAYSSIVDAGSFGASAQPGHGHCDMLSFEMSTGGRRVICNTGTSTYAPSPLRQAERSTAAHNTVELDGAEQSEIWGAFRAGRKARIVERHVERDMIRASHDGYRKLGAVHRRTFRFHGDRTVIDDEIAGPGAGRPAVARIHFVPGLEPVLSGRVLSAGPLKVVVGEAAEPRIAEYGHAVDFNVRAPASVLEIAFRSSLRTEIVFS